MWVAHVVVVRQGLPQKVLSVWRAISVINSQRKPCLKRKQACSLQAFSGLAMQQASGSWVDHSSSQIVCTGVDHVDLHLKGLGINLYKGAVIHANTPFGIR
jgi:hypothetical protein